MNRYDNPMARQALSVPDLLDEVYPDVEHQVRYVLTTPEIYSVKKVVLTSCGDGYAACLAAKRAFEVFLQIPIEVVDPLTLARYYQTKWVGESPCDLLVIALSNSGQVVRVAEAVAHMRTHNAMTIAITGNRSSALGAAAERCIVPSIPPFESAPGVRTYAVLQMILFLLAIRMGEVRLRYTMDQAQAYRRELCHIPREFLSDGRVQGQALALAERFVHASSAEFIGCGADYGTAWYGHAKLYEAVGLPAARLDSEDWFHLNYFLKDVEHTLTMVFAPSGNEAHSRTRELVSRVSQMGREFAVVTDDPALEGKYRFLLPKGESNLLPMASFLAPALVAGYLATLREEPYSRGFQGIWQEREGMYSTTHSAVPAKRGDEFL